MGKTTKDLQHLTVDELVRRFLELGLAQDESLLSGETRKHIRQIYAMRDVEWELKARPGDQRRALVALYGHRNAQVRVKAFTSTLAVESTALQRLEELAVSGEHPQAGEAASRVRNIANGVFRPD